MQNNHPEGHHYLKLTINGKEHEWHHQYITGAEVRELGKISNETEIFLAVKKPWEDELITNETKVDLARPGMEYFYTRHENHKVEIFVNDKPCKVHRGKYTVTEIKNIGSVPQTDELDELIDGKLTPLKDEATLHIKGCEKFFSHKRDGSSS